MFNVKNILACLLFLMSSSSLAFMPATGIWGVDSEDNGLPGRGFQIEAENGIIVFTYFGYRADGSSMFYYASGPVVNNVFTTQMLDVHGGTTMGGAHQNAVVAGSPGNITINFTSGKHGFIAFPGEAQRAISKRPFGYADGPDGLLGTWLLTQKVGPFRLTETRTLNTKVGKSTSSGNGAVTTASGNLICEFQISGTLAGMVVCADYPEVTNADIYMFKFSGDRGSGMAMYKLASGQWSSLEETQVLRTATRSGILTGINDATAASLTQHSQTILDQDSQPTREQSSTDKSVSTEEAVNVEALKAWLVEAQFALMTNR